MMRTTGGEVRRVRANRDINWALRHQADTKVDEAKRKHSASAAEASYPGSSIKPDRR